MFLKKFFVIFFYGDGDLVLVEDDGGIDACKLLLLVLSEVLGHFYDCRGGYEFIVKIKII